MTLHMRVRPPRQVLHLGKSFFSVLCKAAYDFGRYAANNSARWNTLGDHGTGRDDRIGTDVDTWHHDRLVTVSGN